MNFSKSSRLGANLNEQLLKSLVSPYDKEIADLKAQLETINQQYNDEMGIFRHCESQDEASELLHLKWAQFNQELERLKKLRRTWLQES
jgi:predicted RNase H-like nuclease (RuvC/YqgF family)